MDQATKAALFSALLFPGWGQIYLKHYKRGLVFILPILAGTLMLAWTIISTGSAIIKASPFKKGTVGPGDVLSVTVKSLQSLNGTFFLLMIAILLILWLLSVADAYQLGKKMIKATTTAADPESASAQP